MKNNTLLVHALRQEHMETTINELLAQEKEAMHTAVQKTTGKQSIVARPQKKI